MMKDLGIWLRRKNLREIIGKNFQSNIYQGELRLL